MEARNTGVVLVRLFSLFLAFRALQGLLQSLSYYSGAQIDLPPDFNLVILSMIAWTTILPLVASVTIWFLAYRIVPPASFENSPAASAPDLLLIGVSLMGVYFLATTVFSFAADEFRYAAEAANLETYDFDTRKIEQTRRAAARFAYATQALVASAMIVGRKQIAAALVKAKQIGIKRPG